MAYYAILTSIATIVSLSIFDFSISDGFQVIECSNFEEFVKIFEKIGLTEVYEHYIKHSKYRK